MMFLLKKQKYRVSSGFLFKREEVMKKLLLFIIANVFFFSYANAEDKVGMTQEVGLSIPFFQEYVEPEFMWHESRIEDTPLESYGLHYNLKNAFSLGSYLNEVELDASWQYFKHDYWSNTTGTMDDKEHEIFNARLLYGLQVSDKMMLKTGLGYRSLKDPGGGSTSSTGNWGYDRIQEYRFIPFLAEINMPIGSIEDGKLKLEYDHIFYGYNASLLSVGGGANRDLHFRNDDGYIWKTSYKFPYASFYLEPYYEFMSIEESNLEAGSQEPSNFTREYGLKFSKRFGEDSLSAVADNERLLQGSDKFYAGLDYFQSDIDIGITLVSGGSLDEKDEGFSIVSGLEINDFLNLEVGFTEFGEVMQKGNSGDTFTVDGRFNNGASPSGTTLQWLVNDIRHVIQSRTGSLAIKPKFDLGNGIFATADLGLHRWTQTESTRIIGAAGGGKYNYSGVDTFYGVGAGLKKDNFEVSVNYKDYDMYYDAEIIGASLKYNF